MTTGKEILSRVKYTPCHNKNGYSHHHDQIINHWTWIISKRLKIIHHTHRQLLFIIIQMFSINQLQTKWIETSYSLRIVEKCSIGTQLAVDYFLKCGKKNYYEIFSCFMSTMGLIGCVKWRKEEEIENNPLLNIHMVNINRFFVILYYLFSLSDKCDSFDSSLIFFSFSLLFFKIQLMLKIYEYLFIGVAVSEAVFVFVWDCWCWCCIKQLLPTSNIFFSFLCFWMADDRPMPSIKWKLIIVSLQ